MLITHYRETLFGSSSAPSPPFATSTPSCSNVRPPSLLSLLLCDALLYLSATQSRMQCVNELRIFSNGGQRNPACCFHLTQSVGTLDLSWILIGILLVLNTETFLHHTVIFQMWYIFCSLPLVSQSVLICVTRPQWRQDAQSWVCINIYTRRGNGFSPQKKNIPSIFPSPKSE